MKRFMWLALLALACGVAFGVFRAAREPAAPAADEIDEASKEALREILRQENE